MARRDSKRSMRSLMRINNVTPYQNQKALGRALATCLGMSSLGIASGLQGDGNVEVLKLNSYGFKLLLPDGEVPDRSGWKRLADMPVAMLDGDAGFRQFLADYCGKHGVELAIGAECTSFPQAVNLAEEAGWAVFVPEYWWKREKTWAARTQKLPGLEKHQRVFQLGWNRKVVERRPEVARLVKALQGKR